jgi:hypothetical protein
MCQIEGSLYQWRPINSVADPGAGAFFDPCIRDPDCLGVGADQLWYVRIL